MIHVTYGKCLAFLTRPHHAAKWSCHPPPPGCGLSRIGHASSLRNMFSRVGSTYQKIWDDRGKNGKTNKQWDDMGCTLNVFESLWNFGISLNIYFNLRLYLALSWIVYNRINATLESWDHYSIAGSVSGGFSVFESTNFMKFRTWKLGEMHSFLRVCIIQSNMEKYQHVSGACHIQFEKLQQHLFASFIEDSRRRQRSTFHSVDRLSAARAFLLHTCVDILLCSPTCSCEQDA